MGNIDLLDIFVNGSYFDGLASFVGEKKSRSTEARISFEWETNRVFSH